MPHAESATVPRPSKAKALDATRQYLAIGTECEELAKRLDALRREQKIHLSTAAAFLGDEDEARLSGGIVIIASQEKVAVKWKDEVIRIAGAERALELAEQAGTRRKVSIEKR